MDNFFKNCPAKMEDGRHITDYRTATRREETNKYLNNLIRNDDYRLFLQKNANTIIQNEWTNLKQSASCRVNECIHNYPTRVSSSMYCEEKAKYDNLQNPKRKVVYPCESFKDYRLTN